MFDPEKLQATTPDLLKICQVSDRYLSPQLVPKISNLFLLDWFWGLLFGSRSLKSDHEPSIFGSLSQKKDREVGENKEFVQSTQQITCYLYRHRHWLSSGACSLLAQQFGNLC